MSEISKEQIEAYKAERLEKAAGILREAIGRIDRECDCSVVAIAQILDGRIATDIQLITK